MYARELVHAWGITFLKLSLSVLVNPHDKKAKGLQASLKFIKQQLKFSCALPLMFFL